VHLKGFTEFQSCGEPACLRNVSIALLLTVNFQ